MARPSPPPSPSWRRALPKVTSSPSCGHLAQSSCPSAQCLPPPHLPVQGWLLLASFWSPPRPAPAQAPGICHCSHWLPRPSSLLEVRPQTAESHTLPRATFGREPHSAQSHTRPAGPAESLRHTSQALPGPARPPTSHLPLPAALTPRSDHPDPHPARTRPHSPVLAPATLSPTCDPTLPRTEGRLA